MQNSLRSGHAFRTLSVRGGHLRDADFHSLQGFDEFIFGPGGFINFCDPAEGDDGPGQGEFGEGHAAVGDFLGHGASEQVIEYEVVACGENAGGHDGISLLDQGWGWEAGAVLSATGVLNSSTET